MQGKCRGICTENSAKTLNPCIQLQVEPAKLLSTFFHKATTASICNTHGPSKPWQHCLSWSLAGPFLRCGTATVKEIHHFLVNSKPSHHCPLLGGETRPCSLSLICRILASTRAVKPYVALSTALLLSSDHISGSARSLFRDIIS